MFFFISSAILWSMVLWSVNLRREIGRKENFLSSSSLIFLRNLAEESKYMK